MKGGYYGLRGKQLSLTLIALICGTLLIWAWDKTSLLATFLPPQSQSFKPSPDVNMDVPVISSITQKPEIRVNDKIVEAVQGGEERTGQEQVDSAAGNPPGKTDKEEAVVIPVGEKGVLPGSSEEQKNPKQDLVVETRTDTVEKTPIAGALTDSDTTTSYKTEKDDNSVVNLEGKKETLVDSFEEQKQLTHNLNGDTKTENVVTTPDSGVQTSSGNTALSEKKEDENSTVDLEEKKACNYGKGKWVEDSKNRPLYSGFGCKQWLSEMWACRLTQRTDFSYETFRWRPTTCSMPEFQPTSFLQRMQDKTLAIIGDSLGRQQFQSLMCMVTAGKDRPDVLDVGPEYGLVRARGATRPDGWAYRFPSTNTTILYYWSASLTDLEPIDHTNPHTDWAMHLDRPPAFLRFNLHRFDVLVLNTGHHWNRGKINANRWVMYVGGVPNKNRKIAEIGGAKNFTVYSIVKWLDSELVKYPNVKAFFRTISPRHFFHGDWNSGGSCDNTTPLVGGKEVVKDESSDGLVAGAVMGTRVRILDVTALSELRDEGHISRYSIKATPGVQDCLHWCLPGVPDTWNEILAAQL